MILTWGIVKHIPKSIREEGQNYVVQATEIKS